MAIKKLGILVGGGPAPGVNAAIAAVALEAMDKDCAAIGFRDGFEWLAQRYTDEQWELTHDDVSRIHLDGGSILGTSRVSVADDSMALENTVSALRKLAIEALVVIGGDDAIASAAAIERKTEGAVKVVLIPKSIDNDLALPYSLTTLGYETARQIGVGIVESLMEDAKTTGRWYIGITMGRPTGHLTLGIGSAASAACTIIPEEFCSPTISLADICDIVEGSIVKRRAMGKSYGVALLSEALSEHFSAAEVTELQDVDRDAQGNIRVAEIDLGRKVKSEVQSRLQRRGIKATIVDKTIGYELRCAHPIPYDAEHARDLGYAAVCYLLAGGSGAVVTMQNGEFTPVPFTAMLDAEGRGRLRAVDVTSENYQVARDYMVRLNARDFTDEVWVEKLAEAAGMDAAAFKTQFAKLGTVPPLAHARGTVPPLIAHARGTVPPLIHNKGESALKTNALKSLFIVAAGSLLLAGFQVSAHKNAKGKTGAAPAAEVTKAVAVLNPTEGNNVRGTVTFTKEGDKVKVTAHITGLSPGKHGFHIHEFGDCSSKDGAAAGGHFNPATAAHGAREASPRHAGDLGNIEAGADGTAHVEFSDSVLKLDGPATIVGRGLIVHANPDDFKTQPTGNAGGRQACAVIGVAKP